MHIAFLEFVTHFGGAPRATVEFAERLAKHVRVSIVDPYGCCTEFRDAVAHTGIEYHVLASDAREFVIGGEGFRRALRVGLTLPHMLTIRARAIRLLRKLRPTVVCGNNPKSLIMTGTSWRLRRVPLVGHMQGWYRPDMIPAYAKWVYRRRCSALFAVSEATRSALRCGGVPVDKIVVLHYPMDVDEMTARAARLLDDPLPFCERPVRLLVPAGLMRTKGQHTAVRALYRVVETGIDAVLWLAGDLALGGDQSYVEKTKQLAQHLGVTDRVAWLGLRGDLPQIMQRATLVALPTHTEGLPRVILEAMALGKPVATTLAGGLTDLVLPGVTGLSFEVENDAGLADCVLRVVRDAQLGSRLGGRAQEYIRTSPRFSAERQVEKSLAVFRSLSEHRAQSMEP